VNSKRLAATHPAKAERFGRKAQKEPGAKKTKQKQKQINGQNITKQDGGLNHAPLYPGQMLANWHH